MMLIVLLIALLLAAWIVRRASAPQPREEAVARHPDSHTDWVVCAEEDPTDGWDLMSWLLANGVRFHPSVRLAHFLNPGYLDEHGQPFRLRGVATVAPVPASAVLVTVPASLAMDEASLARSSLGPVLAGSRIPELARAAAQLAFERGLGPDSFWAPYIRSLPEAPPSLPFWEDLPACLEGTQVQRAARQLLEHRRQLWREHVAPLAAEHPAVLPYELCNQESFLWACGIVSSRQHPGGLVPVIDLFNHRTAGGLAESSVLTQSHHKAAVALTDLPEATQIFVDYGDRSNQELLLYFGFALELNPYDHTVITKAQAVDTAQELFGLSEERAARVCAWLGLEELRVYADLVPEGVLLWMRALAGTPEELDAPGARELLESDQPFSAQNHAAAHALLHQLCCGLVPPPCELDASQPLAATTRWAVLYIAGQRRVLQRAISRCRGVIDGHPSPLPASFLLTALESTAEARAHERLAGNANAAAHLATRHDQPEVVEALLRSLLQFETALDYHGRSLLHQAAGCGAPRVLQMLLGGQFGVDPNLLAPKQGFVGGVTDQVSALHICATATNQSVQNQHLAASALLGARADPGLVSSRNLLNSLHCAALASNEAVGRVLLEAVQGQARTSLLAAKAANGATPLHTAAATGATNVLFLLLGARVDPETRCQEGKFLGMNALEVAIAHGHESCAALLRPIE